MDLLRNLFGNVVTGIIRLLVAVGILAAAYFFIVKPVLHTTENSIKKPDDTFKKSFGHADKLVHCIQHAQGDVHRIERCTARY